MMILSAWVEPFNVCMTRDMMCMWVIKPRGNIAVTDEFVTRFLDFAVGFEEIAGIDTRKSGKILEDARKFIATKKIQPG